MTLRRARDGDVAAVAALEQEVFGADAWSVLSVREELLGERRVALVACEDGAVVGYVVTAAAGDVVDVQRVAVRPDRRRRGLAGRLLAAALEVGPRVGPEVGPEVGPATGEADRVLLEVGAGNEAALAFYAAQGFTEIDRRPRYYRDGSDAVVMSRPLGADRGPTGPGPGSGPG